jgi:hypothetical protein
MTNLHDADLSGFKNLTGLILLVLHTVFYKINAKFAWIFCSAHLGLKNG